jgi:hypothetical protein
MIKVLVEVKTGDALTQDADVLVLKHAQGLYGLDRTVVGLLKGDGRPPSLPQPWDVSLEDSTSGIAAARLLFVGVPSLEDFGYGEIRIFARKALSALAEELPQTKHILLTVHGVGYGLDEVEAFQAEIAGLVDAVRAGEQPTSLQRITIIEDNERRAQRLGKVLTGLLQDHTITPTEKTNHPESQKASEKLRTAGYASETKPHVFVAMPFKEEMDDIFHYGIQSAVNAAGFLCERVDLSSFTGDIMDRVKLRIRSASLVVADLTGGNANVFLEVGYAWGVGTPTVLVVNGADQLQFDVRGQRCLTYKKIKELEDSLTRELISLQNKN